MLNAAELEKIMEELKNFSACDGHIESVLIGCGTVKVSFQTWDAQKLVIVYNGVESVRESHAVFGDVAEYRQTADGEGPAVYEFFDTDGDPVLSIAAESMKIYKAGENAEADEALFDVGVEYIGGQRQREFLKNLA